MVLLRGERKPPKDLYAEVIKVLYGEHAGVTAKLQVHCLPREYVQLHSENVKSPQTRRGWNYLMERGIEPETVEKFKIGFASRGQYAQRLIFPVEQGGRQVYFTSRYAGKHELKSLNPENVDGYFQRKNCLLNYDNVIGSPVVVLVEGAFDCMAYPNAVALLGKTMSDEQLSLLLALLVTGTTEFVISLDDGAMKDAGEIYRRLLHRVPKVSVVCLDYGDPHDRRDESDVLLAGRGDPSPVDLVRGYLGKPGNCFRVMRKKRKKKG